MILRFEQTGLAPIVRNNVGHAGISTMFTGYGKATVPLLLERFFGRFVF